MNNSKAPKRQLSGHTFLVVNRRHNYANKLLADLPSHEGAFYLMDGDEWQSVKWLGFIERRDARRLGQGACPVRLVNINRIGYEVGGWVDWEDLPPDTYLHGCLTAEGVYVVMQALRRLGLDGTALAKAQ